LYISKRLVLKYLVQNVFNNRGTPVFILYLLLCYTLIFNIYWSKTPQDYRQFGLFTGVLYTSKCLILKQ